MEEGSTLLTPERLAEFNQRLERNLSAAGQTVKLLTGWIPVQVRRFVRLAAMGAVAWVATNLLGIEGDSQTLSILMGVPLQEVLHRSAAPATPDREVTQ